MSQYEFILGDRHPSLFVLRQVKHHEQPKDLGFNTQVIVIFDAQWEVQESVKRPFQVDGSFQLQIEQGPHPTTGADAQINAVSIHVGNFSDITGTRRHCLCIDKGQCLFLVGDCQQCVGHAMASAIFLAFFT